MLTVPDDLSIPAFLLRKDTPEERAARGRTTKQSQRGGVRRVVRTGGRSTISNGYAANLDEAGKAILKEVKAAEKHKREERFARLRELRKERAMLQGPKQAAVREKREAAATGKRRDPLKNFAAKRKAATEMVDLATKVAAVTIRHGSMDIGESLAFGLTDLGEALAVNKRIALAEEPKPKKARVAKAKPKNAPKAAVKASKANGNGTKLELITGLLTRAEGCTTKDVLAATGWPSVSMPQQAKAAGLKLKKEKDGSVTRYHAA